MSEDERQCDNDCPANVDGECTTNGSRECAESPGSDFDGKSSEETECIS